MSVFFARPPLSLAILMLLGLGDLLSTLVLYELGMVQELNPLMRPLLERNPVLFAAVKMATLIAAFLVMQWYARRNWRFVTAAASYGSLAYALLWGGWVTAAHVL